MKYLILSPFFLFISIASASAGVCTAQVQRVCKPNEPCRPSENLTRLTNSPDECASYAKSLCTIFTDGIISKQIRAHFDGQPVGGGQNLCH